ncbi:MAG: metal ABC transporter ATP-binding protein [Rhizobiaceae bacterium]
MLDASRSSEPLVSLSGAGIFRNGRWLVRGVDLSIRPGEIVTLIGPNGSGKSTTARMATGILKPDAGTVAQRTALRVGYVPQRLAIDRSLPLSVGRLMRLTGPTQRDQIVTSLTAAGVAHLENAQVHDLSGGEFQRVLLARAIAQEPDLLVLDEPVQGVDFSGEVAMYELIGAIRDRVGCGVLLISHDLHVVMAATDTVICLNGHVCCSGTPENVAASEEYRSLFGARAAESVAFYRHQHDHTHLPDGRVKHADGSITEHCHPEDGHHDHDHAHSHDHATTPERAGGGGHA